MKSIVLLSVAIPLSAVLLVGLLSKTSAAETKAQCELRCQSNWTSDQGRCNPLNSNDNWAADALCRQKADSTRNQCLTRECTNTATSTDPKTTTDSKSTIRTH